MKCEAVIFDLDGVICHTDQYHYRAWKALADQLGIYFDKAINERLRGVSRAESLEIILEKYDGTMTTAEKTVYCEEKNKIYKNMLKEMSPADLSKEVKETLLCLRARGYKLAIGSSSKNARFILGRIGLENFFDAISDGSNIVNSKPDPEVFLKAAEYLDVKAEACAVVEDAYAGIDAAKAGGMTAFGIGTAAGYEKADHKLTAFSDLLEILS